MGFALVDDKLHSHVKWRRATKGARALWTTALSWCSDHPSDGFVPRDMLRTLDGLPAEAACLVRVGLWDVVPDGWVFHEWSERNPDAASVKAKRKKQSEGGKEGNHLRWHAKKGLVVEGCQWCSVASVDRSGNRRGNRIAPESSPTPTPYKEGSDVTVTNAATHEEPPRLETGGVPSHVIDSTWGPQNRHRAYCNSNGLTLAREVERFRADARSKRKARIDWDAEFDLWLSRSAEYAERDTKADARPGSSVWDRDVTGQGARP